MSCTLGSSGSLQPHYQGDPRPPPPSESYVVGRRRILHSGNPRINPRVPRNSAHLTHLEEVTATTWQSRLPGAPNTATNSNPSQLPQLTISLAAAWMTSARRTFSPAARSLAPEAGPRGPEEKLLFWASPWQRARSFPGAVAEVGGARAAVQVGGSHLGSLVRPRTLGWGVMGFG